MELVKIKYDGGSVLVEVTPCRRCGAVPTAEDAERAVAHARKICRPCAVCGGKPKMYPQYDLFHSTDCSGKGGWILCGSDVFTDPNWHPKWVTTYCTGPAGTVDGAFHLECLKRVAPGIVIHPR